MPDLGAPELIIIAVVVLVLFGSKKLPEAARSLGRSMRIFKSEVKAMGDEATPTAAPAEATPPAAIATPVTSPAGDAVPAPASTTATASHPVETAKAAVVTDKANSAS
jgi:sec-independent protein translocase protein TatA